MGTARLQDCKTIAYLVHDEKAPGSASETGGLAFKKGIKSFNHKGHKGKHKDHKGRFLS